MNYWALKDSAGRFLWTNWFTTNQEFAVRRRLHRRLGDEGVLALEWALLEPAPHAPVHGCITLHVIIDQFSIAKRSKARKDIGSYLWWSSLSSSCSKTSFTREAASWPRCSPDKYCRTLAALASSLRVRLMSSMSWFVTLFTSIQSQLLVRHGETELDQVRSVHLALKCYATLPSYSPASIGIEETVKCHKMHCIFTCGEADRSRGDQNQIGGCS